ncbi:MAG: deoxynucleoside kinase [Bacteroidaceae bacterium]
MHIVIAGNIGSGKTTLTRMLAKHYGWVPKYEPVMENPYLDDYYKDLERWSFNTEVFFLKERFRHMLEINNMKETTIQDRSIYEGVYIFAANNHRQGHMSDRDYEAYIELFGLMTDIVHYPDLMIYLKASISHLVNNIQKRGRGCEQSMQLEYLQGVNDLYEQFITQQYKGRVLIIEVDGMDYEHSEKDFRLITDQIDELVYGLFPLEHQIPECHDLQ